MKVTEKAVSLPDGPAMDRLCRNGRPLFFDIETTGLKAERSSLYLIGCCFPDGESGRFIQWFAQKPREEEALLRSFAELARGFDQLVQFNGNTFDVPYLRRKAARFRIPDDFLDRPGLDLCRSVRPCRAFLGLPNARLKTVEAFLGCSREDRYSGGDLIRLYYEYVRRPGEDLEQILRLHNEEDILGLPQLLPILSYADFLSGDFTAEEILSREEREEADTFVLRLSLSFPRKVSFQEEGFDGMVEGDRIFLTVPRFQGELKYFLPDYSDYFYLPAEDMAIHKSVAAYVDKDFREKATARTAYVRREGTFLKLPGEIGERVFRPGYGGDAYLEERDPAFGDASFWTEYLRRLVCLLHEGGKER